MDDKIHRVVVGPIEANCWLYPLEEDPVGGTQPCVVIDPGDEAGKIVSRLLELNWVPRYVFMTHGHFDHLTALPDLIEACAKGAFKKGAFEQNPLPKIGIHRLEADCLGKDMPQADIIFEEGDTAGPFKVLHVPGHTRGSVAFYDEKAGLLFTGDTLFKGNYGRTDLPGGNRGQIRESLGRLFSMDGEITVCPGHGPLSSIKEGRATIDLDMV